MMKRVGEQVTRAGHKAFVRQRFRAGSEPEFQFHIQKPAAFHKQALSNATKVRQYR